MKKRTKRRTTSLANRFADNVWGEEWGRAAYAGVGHDGDVLVHVLPQLQIPRGAGGEGRHPLAQGLVGLGPDVLGEPRQLLRKFIGRK